MSKSLPSPIPTCTLSLSPFHPRPHQHPKATICPTTPHVHASKQARAQASAVNKKKTALSIFGLLRQGLKRRAAFSAASKIIKTRCNNQSRRRGGSASRTRGGRRKRNTLKMQVTAPLGRTCTYIHVYVRSTKIIPFYRLFLLFFFFFFFCFFFLFVLQWPRKCYWNTIAVQVGSSWAVCDGYVFIKDDV